MTAIPNVDAIARDATWLPHRYDPGHDSVHFVKVTREAHRAATFLTDDHLPTSSEPVVVRRAEAIAEASPPAPLHFIFHSAFCGSTLLARAFDIEGVAMGLKEPVIFVRDGEPRPEPRKPVTSTHRDPMDDDAAWRPLD